METVRYTLMKAKIKNDVRISYIQQILNWLISTSVVNESTYYYGEYKDSHIVMFITERNMISINGNFTHRNNHNLWIITCVTHRI